MNTHVPHPIPYQGSKRRLSETIAAYVQPGIKTLYEPFAGSAAFSLYAASHRLAERFVIGDSLPSLIALWKMIVDAPNEVSRGYAHLWHGQKLDDTDYYNTIRSQYNREKDPILLLYLIVRCVKNAVRFNRNGMFTQSVDKRRLGMHPTKMADAVFQTSTLLRSRVEFFSGDFENCLETAQTSDLVYLDPPYQGTTDGRDKRYYEQLSVARLTKTLHDLNARRVPFLLSYDGLHGEKVYGQPLTGIQAERILICAGRSSQATLNGKSVITQESLYFSHQLAAHANSPVGEERNVVQMSLNLA